MLYCKLQTILAHYYYSVTVGFEYSEQNFSLSIIQKRQRNKTFGNSNNNIKKKNKTKQNKLYDPFSRMGLTISRLQIHNEDTVYFFLPLGHQELFLVLILCTSERWKAELILNKLPGFELGTPELGIQRLNH